MSTLEIKHYWIELIVNQSQLIINFGLVVLIWMVQLIVYPSFLNYNRDNLVIWHQKYTKRIATIVIPLMLTQLFLAIIVTYLYFNLFNVIYLAIVVFLWVFTFTSFAPLHFKISEDKHTTNDLSLLIQRNWWRTLFWSVLFLMQLYTFYFQL